MVFDKNEETGEILLITEKTLGDLTLKGKTGYENYKEELDRLCREITGVENARSITEEDIINSKYWENEIKTKLIFGQDDDFEYWLGTPYVYASSNSAHFGVRFVYPGRARGRSLFSSLGAGNTPSIGVRAVVSLKSEIK